MKIRKGEKTKQHVIETTSLLLNQRGYLSTTLSEITEATGLQKGGLYNHFRDKEELSLESFKYNCSTIAERLQREIEAFPANAVDRMVAYISAYFKMDYPGGCPIANLTVEAESVSDHLFQHAQAAMDMIITFLVETISAGIERQEIPAEIKPRETALFIFSMVEGAILMRKLYPDSIATVLEQIIRYVNAELRVPSGN